MTTNCILLADDLRDLADLDAPYRAMTTRAFVAKPQSSPGGRVQVLNLSRSVGYQTLGYYASLLAEARGHRVTPSVETILELASREGYAAALPELEDALNRELEKSGAARPERLLVCFGAPFVEGADESGLKRFGRLLFDWFRAPAISVALKEKAGWVRVKRLALAPLNRMKEQERRHFARSLDAYTRRAWRSPKEKTPPRYSIAVLYDPKEALPPSSQATLKHWARLAAREGVEVEPITRRDLPRLAEFDALFIRETTLITNHTFRFARRAAAEGMPVIDDPVSMIRCTNKVYLWERLSAAGLPTPKTMILSPQSDLSEPADRLGFPVVLKIPDGSFSRGVKKAANMEELTRIAAAFFADSDLVIAQAYAPTSFDWRVGVLDGAPLFACRYTMAKGHWQIVNHRADGKVDEGYVRCTPLAETPEEVLRVAVGAAGLIRDGLYGVDLKEGPDGPVVIEVNDNPNLDHGLEDGAEKAEVWRRLTQWFVSRLDRARLR